MEIILLQKIQNLGQLGDVVNVKPGYARNYLIPQGKAVRASDSAKADVESRKAELLEKEQDMLAKAQGRADILNGLMIEIPARAAEEGRLFGSVSAIDIADAVTKTGNQLERSEVLMPDGPIKEIGDFQIDIHLHPEVDAQISLKVVPEDID